MDTYDHKIIHDIDKYDISFENNTLILKRKQNETAPAEKPEKIRDLKKCLRNSEMIRHTIKNGRNGESIWYGRYYSKKNEIIHLEEKYGGRSPLNKFVMAHYSEQKPERMTANAWTECEYFADNGMWTTMENIPELE